MYTRTMCEVKPKNIVVLLVDPDDFESPPTTPLVLKQTAAAHRATIASSVDDADSFIYQPLSITIPRQRQSSISNTSPIDQPSSSGLDKVCSVQ